MDFFNFFGINISDVNLATTKDAILKYDFLKPAYISFPDTYVVALSQKDELLRSIINSAFLAVPDGKPSVYFGRKSQNFTSKSVWRDFITSW